MALNQKSTEITYPCNYPIKVIGDIGDGFTNFVMSVVKRHDPEHDGYFALASSKNNKYVSVKFSIKATSETQIRNLFNDLKQNRCVRIVL